ncbi:alpha/beta fold hydrolase [Rufibacter latericius]|nr:alpha/beta hydrolase [Rufibacter latericius]
MNLPPLYLLSGLCADERLFQFLQLNHPSPKVIQWISPDPEDTMATYATKLISQMEPGQDPPVLIGLSFGGMMAQEIAKQIKVKRVILLSSLADTRKLPLHYRVAGALQMQHWLPLSLFKQMVLPAYWLFGAKTQEEKGILKTILQETDIPFLRWSLQQILDWRHQASQENVIVLHGDRDKVLPVPAHPSLHLIKGGEHLMVMSRAKEVSAILNRYLA